jgi:hypothetical protein
MTAEIAKIIDDGLRWYEEELWHDRPAGATVSSNCFSLNKRKTSKRDFVF